MPGPVGLSAGVARPNTVDSIRSAYLWLTRAMTTPTGNPELIAAIRHEIARAGGRLSFARFMELALYHPDHGYYTTRAAQPRIGRQGDFFTSVSTGPLFGRILARQFRHWGLTEVTELGGHRGQLRDDILAAAPELRYRLIEVTDPLPPHLGGCVFSNELLDSFPVHRLVGDQEVYVNADFQEELGPLSDPRLPRLPAGYRSEINLRALDWLTDIARRLSPGSYLLSIDYGFVRPDYFAPHRHAGHLQCYHRHTRNTDPYQLIGDQDITAHVEFSSLIEHGEALGLQTVLFTDQTHFLLTAGQQLITEIVQRDAGQPSRQRNAIHQLLHSSMGQAFKVLVQHKPLC